MAQIRTFPDVDIQYKCANNHCEDQNGEKGQVVQVVLDRLQSSYATHVLGFFVQYF